MMYFAQIAAFLLAGSWLIYMEFTDNAYIVVMFGLGVAYFTTIILPDWYSRSVRWARQKTTTLRD